MDSATLEKILDRAAYELSKLYGPDEKVEAPILLGKFAGRVLKIYDDEYQGKV